MIWDIGNREKERRMSTIYLGYWQQRERKERVDDLGY
jgi:hypothetical protein